MSKNKKHKVINGVTCEDINAYASTTVRGAIKPLIDLLSPTVPSIHGFEGAGSYDAEMAVVSLGEFIGANPVLFLRAIAELKGMPLSFRSMMKDLEMMENVTEFNKERVKLMKVLAGTKKKEEALQAEIEELQAEIVALNDSSLDDEDIAFESVRKDAIKLLQTSVRNGKVGDFAKMADVIDKMEGLFHSKREESKPTAININVVNYEGLDWEGCDEHKSGAVQQYSKERGYEWLKSAWSKLGCMTEEERVNFLKQAGVIQDDSLGALL